VPDSGDPPAPGIYPETYVEFSLAENQGELSGSYHARYKTADLAASPEVFFRAHGKIPSGNSTKLDWTSSDGARGELEITLRSPNSMNITWWTMQAGRMAAPESGKARLIRQQAQ
jgi:hypothetical protein